MKMSSFIDAEKSRPHAVCIPFPAQGHINPMFRLAKLLHHKGFHITFVNTEFNHRRLLKSRVHDALGGIPSFRFETIPDGLPPSDADATQDIVSLLQSTSENCLVPFRDLVSRLNNNRSSSSTTIPPVTCIVSDGVMIFPLEVSEEFGLPNVVLWTASACGLMSYAQFHRLVEKGLIPLQDSSYFTNGYLNTTIDWIPGMENVRLKDLPSFLRTTDPNDFMLNYAIRVMKRIRDASAIILNTFDELEHDVLNALSSIFPKIFTIGPLHLLENQNPESDLKSVGSNLWKEDPACLAWLDSKEPNSVVYVNYGSITVMTPQQLIEFAWGLSKSKQAFLWIIRPDLVIGDSAVLPSEFVAETKERGLLASWCPQEEVLSHPSIGGFLTHCGWNSMFESICAGVPLICWPFFADQQTNCWFCCARLGIGMEIDNDVKRDEVAELVTELMNGKKGKEMKKNVMKWKELAEQAISTTTSSSNRNFEKLVSNVLMSAASD